MIQKTITIQYKPINRTDVVSVELVDRDDKEYRKYLDRLMNRKQEKNNKHIILHERYKREFDEFYRIFQLFFDKHISTIRVEAERTCRFCGHCNPDLYSTGYICWSNYIRGTKPKHTTVHSTCDFWLLPYNKPIQVTLVSSNNIILEKKAILRANNLLDYWNDSRLSHEIKCLRCASNYTELYERIPGVFHATILTNLLRDCYKVNIKKIIIGEGAKEFEKVVGDILRRYNLPILPNILKYKANTSDYPKFKIMDYHTQIDDTHYILEVFRQRLLHEKAVQIKDYVFLLEKTGLIDNIEPILISSDRAFLGEGWFIEDYPEGAKIEGVPFYSEKGLIDWLWTKPAVWESEAKRWVYDHL